MLHHCHYITLGHVVRDSVKRPARFVYLSWSLDMLCLQTYFVVRKVMPSTCTPFRLERSDLVVPFPLRAFDC